MPPGRVYPPNGILLFNLDTPSKWLIYLFERNGIVLASPRLGDLNANARTQADLWIVCGPIWTVRDLDVIEENTSTQFRRACQEPMEHGQFRQLAFDTRRREQVEVSKEKLRELFRVPKFAPVAVAHTQQAQQRPKLWRFF